MGKTPSLKKRPRSPQQPIELEDGSDESPRRGHPQRRLNEEARPKARQDSSSSRRKAKLPVEVVPRRQQQKGEVKRAMKPRGKEAIEIREDYSPAEYATEDEEEDNEEEDNEEEDSAEDEENKYEEEYESDHVLLPVKREVRKQPFKRLRRLQHVQEKKRIDTDSKRIPFGPMLSTLLMDIRLLSKDLDCYYNWSQQPDLVKQRFLDRLYAEWELKGKNEGKKIKDEWFGLKLNKLLIADRFRLNKMIDMNMPKPPEVTDVQWESLVNKRATSTSRAKSEQMQAIAQGKGGNTAKMTALRTSVTYRLGNELGRQPFETEIVEEIEKELERLEGEKGKGRADFREEVAELRGEITEVRESVAAIMSKQSQFEGTLKELVASVAAVAAAQMQGGREKQQWISSGDAVEREEGAKVNIVNFGKEKTVAVSENAVMLGGMEVAEEDAGKGIKEDLVVIKNGGVDSNKVMLNVSTLPTNDATKDVDAVMSEQQAIPEDPYRLNTTVGAKNATNTGKLLSTVEAVTPKPIVTNHLRSIKSSGKAGTSMTRVDATKKK